MVALTCLLSAASNYFKWEITLSFSEIDINITIRYGWMKIMMYKFIMIRKFNLNINVNFFAIKYK